MRRIDAATLRRVAEHHLSRHPSTRASLTRVLERRVANHVRKNGVPAPDDVPSMIASVVDSVVEIGLVDDLRFAESKARSMRGRGKSGVAVRTTLRHKGVGTVDVDAVMLGERLRDGDERASSEIELEAARTLVRRKKLGPFREASTPEQRQRDLATIARAGFSYDVARRALVAAEPDAD